jgi:alpha-glucosidase (family GH31 glycosyl hydrolase)
VGIARTYVTARQDLIAYRSYLYRATRPGMPVMRALFLAYPEDPRVSDMWDEYLYGRDLLVAPVVTAEATSRTVYLPAGCWLDYKDKRPFRGGEQASSNTSIAARLRRYRRALHVWSGGPSQPLVRRESTGRRRRRSVAKSDGGRTSFFSS